MKNATINGAVRIDIVVPRATTIPTTPLGTVVRTATFQSASGYTTVGSARIVLTGSAYTLELQDDFRTSNGGLLDVRLCAQSACTDADPNFGELRSRVGKQVYGIPESAVNNRYVVIYCRVVRLPFGFGVWQ